MRSQNKFALIAILAALLIAGSLSLRPVLAADAPPTQLAVINVVNVFASLTEKLDGDSEIEKFVKDSTEKRRKKEEELTRKSDMLKPGGVFKVDSPEYKTAQDELLQLSMEYQVFLAVSEQQLLMMQRAKTIDLYRKINTAVEKYAKAKGIAIVFVANDMDLTGKDMRELTSQIAMRKIMYYHPNFDITRDIKETMNAEYRMGKNP
jgi:Skp family chaperone for outer membrane proteins